MSDPRCSFYLRTAVGDGRYRYTRISIANQAGNGYIVTPTPPVVGDLIYLRDQIEGGPSGTFRVVERSWVHSSWGSHDWPYTEPQPLVGPMLDLIVEAAEGPFANEALAGGDQ